MDQNPSSNNQNIPESKAQLIFDSDNILPTNTSENYSKIKPKVIFLIIALILDISVFALGFATPVFPAIFVGEASGLILIVYIPLIISLIFYFLFFKSFRNKFLPYLFTLLIGILLYVLGPLILFSGFQSSLVAHDVKEKTSLLQRANEFTGSTSKIAKKETGSFGTAVGKDSTIIKIVKDGDSAHKLLNEFYIFDEDKMTLSKIDGYEYYDMRLSPNREYTAVFDDKKIRIYNLSDSTILNVDVGPAETISGSGFNLAGKFSSDGKYFIYGADLGQANYYGTENLLNNLNSSMKFLVIDNNSGKITIPGYNGLKNKIKDYWPAISCDKPDYILKGNISVNTTKCDKDYISLTMDLSDRQRNDLIKYKASYLGKEYILSDNLWDKNVVKTSHDKKYDYFVLTYRETGGNAIFRMDVSTKEVEPFFVPVSDPSDYRLVKGEIKGFYITQKDSVIVAYNIRNENIAPGTAGDASLAAELQLIDSSKNITKLTHIEGRNPKMTIINPM